MSNLIIVDWGTSNFRAIILDDRFNIVDSISSNSGILQFKKNEFKTFLLDILKPWLEKPLNPTILMSGMIGSKNGWHETSYLLCETSLDKVSNNLFKIPEIEENIYIVPGVKTLKDNFIDLMRGEEIQIFGALKTLDINNSICILPGTHSKWAIIENKNIINFKTNMTGELFNTISTYTILEKTIKSKGFHNDTFIKGVELSKLSGGLLNHIFQIRAQADTIGEDFTNSFLSGILIGHEIKEMKVLFSKNDFIVIGSTFLNDLYVKALKVYSIESTSIDSNEATKEAMKYMYKKLNKEYM